MGENATRGFCNGGRPPFGYTRVKVKDGAILRTTLESDPNAAQVVKRIFQGCLAGSGLKSIVRSLNADGIPSGNREKVGSNLG